MMRAKVEAATTSYDAYSACEKGPTRPKTMTKAKVEANTITHSATNRDCESSAMGAKVEAGAIRYSATINASESPMMGTKVEANTIS